ncbi:MAG: Unknown protein [uncultured Thiotrichaceae bacterium]|uniref:START domain-containing protein n=1 Tax=uncultured Thiotrichaceae bacterium TaxID=298394 RepID=A0A6S6U0A1_9GAMM|nr:MAG: Unknown protein [uncultured Thiotrichaceae bacterium]
MGLVQKVYLLVVLLFMLALVSVANASPWELRRDNAGIKVYQQATASGYAITRGMLEMTTSLEALLTLMGDRSTCSNWVHACIRGELIKQYSPEQRLDYTVIDSPLWFADRDMYIHSITRFDRQSKTVLIELSGREHHDEGQSGRVRVKNLQGFWRIQQHESGKVAIVYQIYSNPQLIKSTLLDAYMVDSVFMTLNNLNRVLQEVN